VTRTGVPESWPDKGAIEFKNVTVRYHQYGVAVLKSVSFAIEAGEKIAIVGRSGSGKTTLLSIIYLLWVMCVVED
jgi:ABC-type bacteriocin/lantibiotic exporter with double-glycine peptidase domain